MTNGEYFQVYYLEKAYDKGHDGDRIEDYSIFKDFPCFKAALKFVRKNGNKFACGGYAQIIETVWSGPSKKHWSTETQELRSWEIAFAGEKPGLC